MELNDGIEDHIVWKLIANGTYSAGSAYKAQLLGSTTTNYLSIIWKAWAPPKCKHFVWLAIQNRLWTSAPLQHRGWPNSDNYVLCMQLLEIALHLFYFMQVFFTCLDHDIQSVRDSGPPTGTVAALGRDS